MFSLEKSEWISQKLFLGLVQEKQEIFISWSCFTRNLKTQEIPNPTSTLQNDAGHQGITVGIFVGSLNPEFTRWFSRPSIQDKREELVNGLTSSMEAALTAFKSYNNYLPDRVILYRDGVGDGQIEFCKSYEVPQFKNAFERIQKGYKPTLTYIIVQKRMNTKFFKVNDGKQGKDSLSNPQPGSILDHTVTNRFMYDFYMISQHVREGTTNPSHYIVLEDDNKFEPDVLQRLTYKLCYLVS
jgi:aubergine-like protein